MAAVDSPWKNVEIDSPSQHYVTVTPHDSTDYTDGVARAIYVGVAGNVVIVRPDDTAITFTGVLAGTVYPVLHKRVNSTSTTATDMVALF